MKPQQLFLASIGFALLTTTAQAQPKATPALPFNPLATTAQKVRFVTQLHHAKELLLVKIASDKAQLAKATRLYSPYSPQVRRAQEQLDTDVAEYQVFTAQTQNKPDNLYPSWHLTMLSSR